MAALSREQVRSCIHPRLPSRYAIAVGCAIIFAPILIILIAFSLVTLILLWIILSLWIGTEVYYHYMMDNSVVVSELNYPRIYHLTEEVRQSLSVKKKIHVFVYEHGEFNAFLMRLFRRRAIFLNSEVLETGVSDDEVRWLIGRFVGYLRVFQDSGLMGRLVRITEGSGIFSLAIFPYSRTMIYTGDRLGLAMIDGDIGAAISAMQKLLVGRQLGYTVNPVGIVEQRRLTKGSLFAFLGRVGLPFPSSIARYVDLLSFAKRTYPGHFQRFEAGCPGLPGELDRLSGERTSFKSVAKAIGYYLAIFLGLLVTALVWAILFVAALRGVGSPLALLGTQAPVHQPDADVAPPVIAPPPQAMAPLPAQPIQAAPPVASERVIDNPIIIAAPSDADIASAYPPQAGGVAGKALVRCHARDDGSLFSCAAISEDPAGSGFGDAAVPLAERIRLAERDGSGTSVGGGVTDIAIPFAPK